MKTCKITGCNNRVWSQGMCQKHIPKTPLKKTSFKSCPIPEKKTGLTKIIEEVFDDLLEGKVYKPTLADKITKRNLFFTMIWEKNPHYCQICNKYLGREPRTFMFDHLLEKEMHPDLEFEEENIALVCLSCHDEKTRGRINEKYQEKINFVRTKFNKS